MHAEYRALLATGGRRPGGPGHRGHGSGRGFCAGADSRALEGHVASGRLRPGARRRRRQARLRRAARVRRRLRLPLRDPQADHRRRSTGRRRASASSWPATATCASPRRAPSSPPRTAGSACRRSTACRGCCRGSSASPGRPTCCSRAGSCWPRRRRRSGWSTGPSRPTSCCRVHLRLRRAAGRPRSRRRRWPSPSCSSTVTCTATWRRRSTMRGRHGGDDARSRLRRGGGGAHREAAARPSAIRH